MNKMLSIPVQICADDGKHLTLQTITSISDCPQCAQGKGCGQNIWFRGLLGEQPFQVPRPATLPPEQRFLELHLPQHSIHTLSLLLYGLPLTAFIITLSLSQTIAAYLQFILAMLALILSLSFSKNLRQRLLLRHLSLHLPPNARETTAVKISLP